MSKITFNNSTVLPEPLYFYNKVKKLEGEVMCHMHVASDKLGDYLEFNFDGHLSSVSVQIDPSNFECDFSKAKDFEASVNAKTLFYTLNRTTGADKVVIETDGKSMTIKAAKKRFKIPIMPTVPSTKLEEHDVVDIDFLTLRKIALHHGAIATETGYMLIYEDMVMSFDSTSKRVICLTTLSKEESLPKEIEKTIKKDGKEEKVKVPLHICLRTRDLVSLVNGLNDWPWAGRDQEIGIKVTCPGEAPNNIVMEVETEKGLVVTRQRLYDEGIYKPMMTIASRLKGYKTSHKITLAHEDLKDAIKSALIVEESPEAAIRGNNNQQNYVIDLKTSNGAYEQSLENAQTDAKYNFAIRIGLASKILKAITSDFVEIGLNSADKTVVFYENEHWYVMRSLEDQTVGTYKAEDLPNDKTNKVVGKKVAESEPRQPDRGSDSGAIQEPARSVEQTASGS